MATEVSRAAAVLSAEGHGALIVIERETGLEQIAETGVMIHGDLSADLLRTSTRVVAPVAEQSERRAQRVAALARLDAADARGTRAVRGADRAQRGSARPAAIGEAGEVDAVGNHRASTP